MKTGLSQSTAAPVECNRRQSCPSVSQHVPTDSDSSRQHSSSTSPGVSTNGGSDNDAPTPVSSPVSLSSPIPNPFGRSVYPGHTVLGTFQDALVRDEINAIDEALQDAPVGDDDFPGDQPRPPSQPRHRPPPLPADADRPALGRRNTTDAVSDYTPSSMPFSFGAITLKRWVQRTRDVAVRIELARKVREQRAILWQAKQDLMNGNNRSARLRRRIRFQRHGNVGSAIFAPLDTAGDEHHENYDGDEHGMWPDQKKAPAAPSPIIEKSHSEGNDGWDDDSIEDDDFATPVVVVEEEDDVDADVGPTPLILTPAMMAALAADAIPASLRWSRWKRIYSLGRDGDTFETMITKVKGYKNTLLVVQTTAGAIFGGFAGEEWSSRPTGSSGAFYGNGQSLLYSFDLGGDEEADSGAAPDGFFAEAAEDEKITEAANAAAAALENTPTPAGAEGDEKEEKCPPLQVFPWTGSNRYFQVCDTQKTQIAMGGGGVSGSFGLCLTTDFTHGSTGPCDTFGNTRLISMGSSCRNSPNEGRTSPDSDGNCCNFDVVDFEIYGFGSAW